MATVLKLLQKSQIHRLGCRSFKIMSNLRAEKVVEQLKETNPYYEKYAAKIAALQNTSPDELLSRLESIETKKGKKSNVAKEQERNYTELLSPKDPVSIPSSEVPHKKLVDIMKLDLIKDKTVEEIKLIWLEYHKNKDVISATLTKEHLNLIMNRAKHYPIFILPLPRSQGYEFFVMQFAANTVHFTPLLCYQVHKENAPECLNMVHYMELEDRNLILMRGEYDSKVINSKEAQCLANQFQLYYGQNNESKLNLMKKFTKTPDSFKHMDLIKELENLSLI